MTSLHLRNHCYRQSCHRDAFWQYYSLYYNADQVKFSETIRALQVYLVVDFLLKLHFPSEVCICNNVLYKKHTKIYAASTRKTKLPSYQPGTSHILDHIAFSLPRDITNKLMWKEGLLLEKYFLRNKKITFKPFILKFIICKNKIHTNKW